MASSNEIGYSARSIRNGLIAGYSAGICGIVVGHPLDSIKVLLQTGGGVPVGTPSSNARTNANAATNAATAATTVAANGHVMTRASSGAASAQSSSVKANVSTVSGALSPHHGIVGRQTAAPQELRNGKRSLRALYAGVTGPLLTIGILQSVNFAIYDSVRRALYQRQLESGPNGAVGDCRPGDYLHYDDLSNVAIASFASGAATSVVSSPMLVVKTKQQLMVWGFRRAIRETHRTCGLRSFYTGFGVHFLCEAFGRSVYMFTYEALKRELARMKCTDPHSNRVSTRNLSMSERALCAASAGMTCWAFIFPADAMRSKLYARSLAATEPLTASDGIEMARRMVREKGFSSLYRGMAITVARAGPVAAAVLPVYDSTLAWVSS